MSILDRLKAGQPIEDSRVELKSEWIDSKKAARRIAGHANASHGEPILWLMGVDEKRGVVGANHTEMSTWWSKVESEFNELAPSLIRDMNVPYEGKTVVALLFENDRAPYVVRCPDKPDILEVPWREGTKVRSARRSDLIKVLSPLTHAPEMEVRSCDLNVQRHQRSPTFSVRMLLYVVLRTSNTPITIPCHRCSAEIHLPGHSLRCQANRVYFEAANSTRIQVSPGEATISGSGEVWVNAYGDLPGITKRGVKEQALVDIELNAIGMDRPLHLRWNGTTSPD